MNLLVTKEPSPRRRSIAWGLALGGVSVGAHLLLSDGRGDPFEDARPQLAQCPSFELFQQMLRMAETAQDAITTQVVRRAAVSIAAPTAAAEPVMRSGRRL